MAWCWWLTCVGLVVWVDITTSSPPLTLHYTVPEEVVPGTLIANVMKEAGIAQKFSADVLTNIRFRFLSQPPVDFDLEMTTGSLFTSSRFDREDFCPFLQSCVLKVDVALQPVQFFQIIKLDISVEDLNDNTPEFFPKSVSHQLFESATPGTSITLPTALDMDSPAFSITNYQLIDTSNTFGLEVLKNMDDSIEVKLILLNPLDREVQDLYQLQLVAEDGGGLTGTANVAIQVLDTNDNNPVFSNTTYQISVMEGVDLGTIVIQMQAEDPDEGENGEVRYSFSERTLEKSGSLFSIDEVTGDVKVVGDIDHEQHSVIHLVVIARDQGQGTLPAEVMLVVEVEDINDNPPDIKINTLTTSLNAAVSEEAPQGTFVAHVIVKDKDSGKNGKFDCHLVHNKMGLMKIIENEYQIVTKGELDRELESYYDITVKCVDHGKPHLESSKDLRILINDFNDNPPHFPSSGYQVSLAENSMPGMVVIQINATDVDIGRNSEIEYSLPFSDLHLFSVNPANGVVRTAFSFDREMSEKVHFHVIATDKGTPALSSSVLVTLNISDVNDQAPEFLQKGYSFGVMENEAPNSDVGQVAAIDRDSFPNNQFHFAFFPLNSDIDSTETFRIDSQSGAITTIRTLDRETKASYNFVISATDQGTPPLSSTSSVTVYVADKNDRPPVITFPSPFNNTVKIPLSAQEGFVVSRIVATDSDLGEFAKLSYKLLNDSYKGLFVIDPDYGVVTLTRDIDLSKSRYFTLVVVVSDCATPVHTVRTTLNVYVDSTMVVAEVAANTKHTTAASFLESNNFIIVLALAVASGVIMVILILAIILIHRHNRIKREKKYGRYNCRKEALRIFPNMSQASDERTLTMSGNASTLTDTSVHRHKKEVSFCLDGSHPTSEGDMSDVVRGAKRPESRQSLPSTIDQHVLQYPQAHSSSLSVQVTTCMASSQSTALATTQPTALVTTQPTALASSAVLGVIHEHDEQRQLEVERLMAMLRRNDEQQSEGSVEEGSVTDSGRGPSEEGDPPSNSELPTYSHDVSDGSRKSKAESMQVVPNLSSVSTNLSSSTDSQSESRLKSFTLEKGDEYRVSSHKDRQGTSVASDSAVPPYSPQTHKSPASTHTDSVLSDWRKPGHDTQFFYGSYLDYLKKKNPGHLQVADSPCLGASMEADCSTDTGLAYSLADMTDCGRLKPAQHSTVTEPDTTSVTSSTSGTYVVDPQALCNEIDALFFKDTSHA